MCLNLKKNASYIKWTLKHLVYFSYRITVYSKNNSESINFPIQDLYVLLQHKVNVVVLSTCVVPASEDDE